MVSKLIQQYENKSGAFPNLEGHLRALATIGEEFVTPSNILPEDLKKLERSLGNLVKLLKQKDAPGKDIQLIKTIISEISYHGNKKPERRSIQEIRNLMDIGDKLIDLRTQLSALIAPFVFSTLMELLNKT